VAAVIRGRGALPAAVLLAAACGGEPGPAAPTAQAVCRPADPALGQPELCVGPGAARVGALATLAFALRVPARGLPAGGALQIELPAAYQDKLADFLLSTPQAEDPAAPGYVVACVGEGAQPCRDAGEQSAAVAVAGRVVTATARRALAAGSRLGLLYRGQMRRNAGSLVWKFRSDLDADGRFEPAGAPGYFAGPGFVFEAEPPAYVVVSAPADLVRGEPFALDLVAHDRFANAAAPAELGVSLRGEGLLGLPERIHFADGPIQRVAGVRCERGGFLRIGGSAEGGLPLHGQQSYVHEAPPAQRRLFGDLQFHTGTGSGQAWDSFVGGDHRGQYTEARQAYDYARRVARLDFAALSEHDLGSTPQGFREAQRATEEFERLEDFTAFRAYEWTPKDWAERGLAAHQVVLYRGGAGEVLAWEPERGGAEPYAELLARLEAQRRELAARGLSADFLLIPHPMGTEDEVAGGRHPIFAPGRIDERGRARGAARRVPLAPREPQPPLPLAPGALRDRPECQPQPPVRVGRARAPPRRDRLERQPRADARRGGARRAAPPRR
jgi:hypothetical protein